MNHLKNIVLTVSLIGTITLSHAQQNQFEHSTEKSEMSEIWQQFLAVLSANDKTAFKAVSNKTIKCYDCLENTPEEQHAINLMRANDSIWYERIYEDMIFVPISDFVVNDYDLLFTEAFVKTLHEHKTILVRSDIDDETGFEVLVTTVERTEDFEGMQHAFRFVKVGDSYKFSALNTIP